MLLDALALKNQFNSLDKIRVPSYHNFIDSVLLSVSAGNIWTHNADEFVTTGSFTSYTAASSWTTSGSITASITVGTSYNVILANCVSGSISATLPSAIGLQNKVYNLKKTDSSGYLFTILTSSTAQTIDGLTAVIISKQNSNMQIISDNSNWWRL